jgi:hypothetical protein
LPSTASAGLPGISRGKKKLIVIATIAVITYSAILRMIRRMAALPPSVIADCSLGLARVSRRHPLGVIVCPAHPADPGRIATVPAAG